MSWAWLPFLCFHFIHNQPVRSGVRLPRSKIDLPQRDRRANDPVFDAHPAHPVAGLFDLRAFFLGRKFGESGFLAFGTVP